MKEKCELVLMLEAFIKDEYSLDHVHISDINVTVDGNTTALKIFKEATKCQNQLNQDTEKT